jgi:hypothetical protein
MTPALDRAVGEGAHSMIFPRAAKEISMRKFIVLTLASLALAAGTATSVSADQARDLRPSAYALCIAHAFPAWVCAFIRP